MKKDIAKCISFHNTLELGKYYDFETPYGYGGPLCDTKISQDSQSKFMREIMDYCHDNKVISQFVRFHPILQNHNVLSEIIETRYLRDTIYIDTSNRDLIMNNMDSKNRNMVRKAIKNGVTIVRESIEKYNDFFPMYADTMRKNNADEYYIFDEIFFESLKMLKDNGCFFYAMFDGKPIGGAIMLYNEEYMHYHLSGTHTDYRKYSSSNLLLYEAACWASEQGIRKFHLGGGMIPDDSLFGFKKQFNKFGRLPFVVGRTVFDKGTYAKLLDIRKKMNPNFDENNSFMIQYRMP